MVKNTITLEVIEWAMGGGEHLTGKLNYYDTDDKYQSKKLRYKLTESQAVKLNKSDSIRKWRHDVGEESDRFFSYPQIFKVAIKKAKEINPNLTILFMGSWTTSMNEIVWMEDKKSKEKLNEIYVKYNKIAHRRGRANEDATDVLIDEWEDAFKKYEKKGKK